MNNEVIVFRTAFVRAILVELECHCGKEMRCPELSKLQGK